MNKASERRKKSEKIDEEFKKTLPEIYKHLENHPKHLTNPTFKATIRRTLQESATSISKGVWEIRLR